jgi:hypothetical protein
MSSPFSLAVFVTGSYKYTLRSMEKGKICMEMDLLSGMQRIAWFLVQFLAMRIIFKD